MTCSHTKDLNYEITPKTPNGCEECLREGMKWVELRLCLTCGHVGCCDSSAGKHATKHFHDISHPVIMSFTGKDRSDEWKWCYIDKEYVELD